MSGLISDGNTLCCHIEYKNHTKPRICLYVNNRANVKTKPTELVIIKTKLLARHLCICEDERASIQSKQIELVMMNAAIFRC